MELSSVGALLIKQFEGCELQAYKCSAGVWTIGYGNTYHPDGKPVVEGDEITTLQANEYFDIIVKRYSNPVNELVKSDINQNNFDALVSIVYNIGVRNFQKSTLLRLVNLNPNTPNIQTAFFMWDKSNGIELKGLVNRRKAEWLLYSTK